MNKISKLELSKMVAEQLGREASDVKEVVETAFNTVAAELGKGNIVALRGIGSFALHKHEPRNRYDINTDQVVEQPGFLKVEFEAAQAFEQVVEDQLGTDEQVK